MSTALKYTALALAASWSCTPHGAAPAVAAAPGLLGSASAPLGEPGWVNRGSAAIHNSSGRIFYGVGSASAIKDPALLREAADNRALAELGKVFATFSATLMHDAANSKGAQDSRQAVQTFSAMSLRGAQVVDRYVARDGTLFALAALDTAKVDLLAQAQEAGVLGSTVPPSIDESFDAQAQPNVPAPAMTRAMADSSAGAAAPGELDRSSASVRRGATPPWVGGADSRYPNDVYLCAVGMATEREAAEDGAYAALSKVFSAQVESSSQDLLAAYAATGAADLNIAATEVRTRVATQATLQGVRIFEVYADGLGHSYGLACLERRRVAPILRQEIAADDRAAAAQMAQIAGLDRVDKIHALERAMDIILRREAANTQLRIVQVDGVGLGGTYTPADVASALDVAVQALRVGLRVQGPYDSELRAALMTGLTSQRYTLVDIDGAPQALIDVLVKATTQVEDAGTSMVGSTALQFARGQVAVEVINTSNNRVLAAFTETRKEGSRNSVDAARRAMRSLAGAVTSQIGNKIDRAMKGAP